MYIQEVIIDGFKSYAQRTVVSGWDQQFNAITGLNGSGKSNILDSICFVLGISNLSQVRVGNLQELIYKQGQSGVTKASVTIVFNNSDPKSSPVGYEQNSTITVTRQVAVGGKNKYLINGHNAQQNRVQNLFHSVQLNVNNPHFLIMQGRITKVLNMKPPEILGMIEEAAGTRMFEMKKEAALKTIEKKDKKVEEISKMLAEEITPRLEKLRKERLAFQQWTAANNELQHLEKFCIAYDYTRTMASLQSGEAELEAMRGRVREFAQEKIRALALDGEVSKKVEALHKKRSKELDSGLRTLETLVGELSKDVVKLTSMWSNKEETLDSEKKTLEQTLKSVSEVDSGLTSKSSELSKAQEKLEKLKADAEKLQEKVSSLQQHYQATSAGLASDSDGDKSWSDQLAEAKQARINSETESKQAQLKQKHAAKTLADKTKAKNAAEKEVERMQFAYSKATETVASVQAQLDALKFDPQRYEQMRVHHRQAEEEVKALRETVDALSAQLSGFQFVYTDPEKNFDRSKVKGLVAELLSVRDASTSTALEVAAGGKLYQVIVDSEQTGKLLLNKGKLKKRVTIIPLNKIDSRGATQDAVATAKSVGGSVNVDLALSLVGYDDEIAAAMQYVFGNVFVCRDAKTANTVTFNPRVMARSVTLEGDVYDPSGTLTGGSRPAGGSVLAKLQELAEKKRQLAQAEEAFVVLTRDLATMEAAAAQHAKATQQLDLKAREAQLLKDRMVQSSHQQTLDELQALEAEIAAQGQKYEESIAAKETLTARCAELENQITHFQSHREDRMKTIEGELAEAKKKAASASKALKEQHATVERLQLELEELQNEKSSSGEHIGQLQARVAELQQDFEKAGQAVAEKKREYEEAESQLKANREKAALQNKEIAALMAQAEEARHAASEAELEGKKTENELKRMDEEQANAARRLHILEETHPWIRGDKRFFGLKDTAYDFTARDPKEATARYKALSTDHHKLSKNVNKKATSMFESAETEYQDLMTKKRIIENDKKKIQAVIEELEEKKTDALRVTWQKVNKDFGSIFSTLLPGVTAKLDPVSKNVLDGLEVKVAFGDVWKESLTELSGGQRSLLALSLILAMLLFKPAPMYILDEVDAALDLSHTQNIGQMIKTHFKHSQFIVVSLKEGMFSNANVLFRTKFVDGVSTVMRTTGK
mmetsp:Transcript_27648/g.46362  ORF Transcript_27648/g.46362 Transcript_27648/m.46362 type:complete len:1173 (+) Transcript_27648:65-3583(+)